MALCLKQRSEGESTAAERQRLLAHVEELVACGLAVFPLNHPDHKAPLKRPEDAGKVPVEGLSWKRFQTRQPTPEEISELFTRSLEPRNIALVTGPISGLVAVDADNAAAVEWCRANLPDTPLKVATAKGEHWFYRWDPAHPLGNKARLATGSSEVLIDIRAEGGYVVAAGSRHRTGVIYRTISGAWTPETIQGLPFLPPARISGAIKSPPPSPEFRYTGGNASRTIEHARRYAAAIGPAIQGEGGDHRTYRLSCILVNDFALPEADAWRVLLDWNTTCVPPWSEAELRRKLKNALLYGRGEVGCKVKASGRDGVSGPSKIHSLVRNEPDSPQIHSGQTSDSLGQNPLVRDGLPFRTAREVANSTPETVEWIWPGYLACGAVTEWDGKPKSGKTSMLLAVTKAAVTGGEYLGHRFNRTAVLLLTEQTPTTLLPALERAGLLDSEIIFLFWHEVASMPWAKICAEAVAKCKRMGAKILAVDTISQFARIKDENAASEWLEALKPLQLAAAEGLAVWLARHDRKSGGEVGDSGRGSNACSGAVDIIVSLTRPEGNAKPTMRVLKALSRFEETPAEQVIERLPDGRYISHGDTSRVVEATTFAAVCDLLPFNEERALTEDEILRGIDNPPSRTTLRRVLGSGSFQKVGRGRKGDPLKYFQILCDQTPRVWPERKEVAL